MFATTISVFELLKATGGDVQEKNVQSPSGIREGYVSSPPANPENPRNINAVLKRLCMILYTLKYASKTHSKHSLNSVVM